MSYKIISKFIKDISFEIPNTKAFVMLEKEIPNYALNFDIKSNPYKNNIIEVNTTLKISPNENVKHKILTEITCTTLVSIEKNFEDIILIKIFLVIGIINKKPIISVKNPGIISNKAANANAAPDMISYIGTSFFTI